MNIRSIGLAALLFTSAAGAQEMELQVELMGPLGSKVSHKGDRIFGRVTQPDVLKGDMVEGIVTEARSGGKLHGNSVLNFRFETLQHAGQAVPISTQIKSFQNSHGQADVDEEGRVIRKGGGNTSKALAGTAAGGLIGGLAGGWRGAAIGSGVGAAASIAVIEIAADSPEIRFNPGSIVTLMVKSRSGPALAALVAAPGAPPPPSAAPAQPAAVPSAAATAPAGAPAQPNLVTLKAEFIPGEKTLFYDDFTDMSPDEAPPHWKVRGSSLTMKEGGGVRELSATDKVNMTPMLNGFPKNFTVETEVRYENPGDLRATWLFFPKGSDNEALKFWTETRTGALRVIVEAAGEQLVDTEVPCDFNKPVKEAIWVQNGRVRFYVNGQRAMDANQVQLPPLETARLEAVIYADNALVGFRGVRIAESTPDFGRSILASGRYVTYGILFDTDSDRLKPESAAVLKSIATGLQANPALKVCIEGHTDSTGAAEHNVDLSKRRAEAVRTVLVSQFQIDPARLTADGLGASKPVAPNDTAQGRAQNRRVEFARM